MCVILPEIHLDVCFMTQKSRTCWLCIFMTHISPACALSFGNTTNSLKTIPNSFFKSCAWHSTDRNASNRESHYFTWTFMGQVKMLCPACLYVTFPSLINETFRQSQACAETSRSGRVWPKGLFPYCSHIYQREIFQRCFIR